MQESSSARNSTPASIWSLLTGVALVVFATVLGFYSAGDNVHKADQSLADHVQAWQGSVPETLQRFGDMLGGTAFTAIAAVSLLALMLVLRRMWAARFLATVAVLRLTALLLKGVFDSPRPTADTVQILRTYESAGYPSGHSMSIMMATGAISVLVWHTSASRTIRLATGSAAALLTLLVGWSRVWAGAHWPSDVLGGWSFGAGFIMIAFWFVCWLDQRTAVRTVESSDAA